MDRQALVEAADALLARAGFGPGGTRFELRRNEQAEFEERNMIPAGIVPKLALRIAVSNNYGKAPAPSSVARIISPPPTPAMKSCWTHHRVRRAR